MEEKFRDSFDVWQWIEFAINFLDIACTIALIVKEGIVSSLSYCP